MLCSCLLIRSAMSADASGGAYMPGTHSPLTYVDACVAAGQLNGFP
jgi:hypothetical protein